MEQYQVVGGNLKMRRMPSSSAGVLKLIGNGATVQGTGEKRDGWTRISYEGIEGYCQDKNLRVLSENSLDEDSLPAAIETAYANVVNALQELKSIIDAAL